MSVIISWAIIGMVFFAGIMLERFFLDGLTFIDWKDAASLPFCVLLVAFFWPVGLLCFEWSWQNRSQIERARFQQWR